MSTLAPAGSPSTARAPVRADPASTEETVTGRRHVVNMPTEEVFTSPHRLRTEGIVRSTVPLAVNGQIVRDLADAGLLGALAGVGDAALEIAGQFVNFGQLIA